MAYNPTASSIKLPKLFIMLIFLLSYKIYKNCDHHCNLLTQLLRPSPITSTGSDSVANGWELQLAAELFCKKNYSPPSPLRKMPTLSNKSLRPLGYESLMRKVYCATARRCLVALKPRLFNHVYDLLLE